MFYSNMVDGLRYYGIDYLTGEACNVNMRGLFELNEKGRNILREFFGALSSSPNRIYLPKNSAFLNDLLAFCMLREDDTVAVWICNDGIRKITAEFIKQMDCNDLQELKDKFEKAYTINKMYRKSNHPAVGLSNISQIMGGPM